VDCVGGAGADVVADAVAGGAVVVAATSCALIF
jgi:hypothetical protein